MPGLNLAVRDDVASGVRPEQAGFVNGGIRAEPSTGVPHAVVASDAAHVDSVGRSGAESET